MPVAVVCSIENDAGLDQRPPIGEAGQIGICVAVDLAPACDANLPRQARLDLRLRAAR